MKTSYIVTTSYCGGNLAKSKCFETLEQANEFENWYKNELKDSGKFYILTKVTKGLFKVKGKTVKEWAED